MSILITSLKLTGALIATLAGSGAMYQYVATKLDEKAYPPIGKMVDIGGYKLHMIDRGVGGPTVVIDAGGGDNSLDWSLVQPEIAKFTRVVVYDRAGYAWSNASSLERTSENIAKELHTMLHNANIPAPYILVGHSFGGINVRFFANMYPDEVAGVVLVDSSHEDQGKNAPASAEQEMNRYYYEKLMRTALGIFRLSQYTPSGQIKFKKSIALSKFSPEIQEIYFAQKFTTKRALALLQESSCKTQSFKQLKNMKNMLGDKPLIVITLASRKDKEDIALHADLVTKSSRGKLVFADNSGHNVNYDQPEIIVEAVREMVEELRNEK